MGRLTLKITIIFLIFSLFACASKPQVKPAQEMPKWISEPGDGAVGSCLTHVRGRHYQEDLAIARARERLAARYGVEVSSVQTIKEKVVNDSSSVRSDKKTDLRVSKNIVKAHVRAVWLDEARDEIWVWVYPVSD